MMTVLLKSVANLSPDKYKVGAIYVQGWRISFGYNTSRDYGSHAEDMAIRMFEKLYKPRAQKGTMYCTWSPCSVCAKNLFNLGIRPWYLDRYTGKL